MGRRQSQIGRLLNLRRRSAAPPAMPLAAAHFERARETLREAAGRVAGAANAPTPRAPFLDEGVLLAPDDADERAAG